MAQHTIHIQIFFDTLTKGLSDMTKVRSKGGWYVLSTSVRGKNGRTRNTTKHKSVRSFGYHKVTQKSKVNELLVNVTRRKVTNKR